MRRRVRCTVGYICQPLRAILCRSAEGIIHEEREREFLDFSPIWSLEEYEDYTVVRRFEAYGYFCVESGEASSAPNPTLSFNPIGH